MRTLTHCKTATRHANYRYRRNSGHRCSPVPSHAVPLLVWLLELIICIHYTADNITQLAKCKKMCRIQRIQSLIPSTGNAARAQPHSPHDLSLRSSIVPWLGTSGLTAHAPSQTPQRHLAPDIDTSARNRAFERRPRSTVGKGDSDALYLSEGAHIGYLLTGDSS